MISYVSNPLIFQETFKDGPKSIEEFLDILKKIVRNCSENAENDEDFDFDVKAIDNGKKWARDPEQHCRLLDQTVYVKSPLAEDLDIKDLIKQKRSSKSQLYRNIFFLKIQLFF